jgi:hypothetical protein
VSFALLYTCTVHWHTDDSDKEDLPTYDEEAEQQYNFMGVFVVTLCISRHMMHPHPEECVHEPPLPVAENVTNDEGMLSRFTVSGVGSYLSFR